MTDKPRVVVLLGSTRFQEAQELAMMHETLMGRLVIPCGLYGHTDHPQGAKHLTSDGDETHPNKQAIDGLHFRKIDLADECLVVNPGMYIGSSTQREISYAQEHGKTVRYMFNE